MYRLSRDAAIEKLVDPRHRDNRDTRSYDGRW
jgi:hypothetical protein